jgi:hypothetical protein
MSDTPTVYDISIEDLTHWCHREALARTNADVSVVDKGTRDAAFVRHLEEAMREAGLSDG